MGVLKFLAGFLWAAPVVPFLFWISFAYPYMGVDLKWFWWGLGIGAAAGVLYVLCCATLFAIYWPMD